MLIGWVVNLGLVITFLVISLHGNLSWVELFVLFVSLAIAAVNVHSRYFFSIVLFISYICKVIIFIDFCRLYRCPIFALTNYNNKQFNLYNYDNCKQF